MSAHVKRRAGCSHNALPTSSQVRLRCASARDGRQVARCAGALLLHACIPDHRFEDVLHGGFVVGAEALLPRGVAV